MQEITWCFDIERSKQFNKKTNFSSERNQKNIEINRCKSQRCSLYRAVDSNITST